MSNAQQATTTRAPKPARASRLPVPVPDNTNGTPPVMQPEAPRLTPQLVMAVLREIERHDGSDFEDVGAPTCARMATASSLRLRRLRRQIARVRLGP